MPRFLPPEDNVIGIGATAERLRFDEIPNVCQGITPDGRPCDSEPMRNGFCLLHQHQVNDPIPAIRTNVPVPLNIRTEKAIH